MAAATGSRKKHRFLRRTVGCVAKSHHIRTEDAVLRRLITCEVATTCQPGGIQYQQKQPRRVEMLSRNAEEFALEQRAVRACCSADAGTFQGLV